VKPKLGRSGRKGDKEVFDATTHSGGAAFRRRGGGGTAGARLGAGIEPGPRQLKRRQVAERRRLVPPGEAVDEPEVPGIGAVRFVW